jgi:hypothetical protein
MVHTLNSNKILFKFKNKTLLWTFYELKIYLIIHILINLKFEL